MDEITKDPQPEVLEVVKPPQSLKSSILEFTGKALYGDTLAWMKKIPNRSVRVVVTSPPYNLRNSTGGGLHNGSGGKWEKAKLLEGYEMEEGTDNYEDAMPHEDYVHWQRKCLREMMRILRNDGAIFYNHKWRVQRGRWQDRSDIVNGLDLPVRQIIIWKRAGGVNFNTGYFLPTYEVIYLFARPGFHLAKNANALTDVWEMLQDKTNPHPAPFPVELAERCIKSVGRGVVLDPFFGSGTTGVAAENLGRPWIGIDNSRKYCAMAEKRITEERQKRELAKQGTSKIGVIP